MVITRRDLLAFGQALLLAMCVNLSLTLMLMVLSYFDLALADLPYIPTALFLVFWPVASIVAGLVFLRRRVTTRWWLALDGLFVGACFGAGAVLFLVGVWITGDGP